MPSHRRPATFVLAAVAIAAAAGCADDDRRAGGVDAWGPDSDGQEADPVAEYGVTGCEEGSVTECLEELWEHNGVRHCFAGVRHCVDGRWGPCVEDDSDEREVVN